MNPTTNTEAGAVADVAAKLTDRDREMLSEMIACDGETRWLRPLDCGGGDCTDHSYRMAKLARIGLAERRRRNTLANDWNGRGSYVYRVLPTGLAARQHLEQGATAGVPELNEHMFGQGSNQ